MKNLILVLTIIAAGLGGAVLVEHGAIAYGQSLGSSDVAPAEADGEDVDPVAEVGEIIGFARSGKGRLAFGTAIMLLVWILRTQVGKRHAWFKSMTGGYVLGFGTAALFYVGGALLGDVPITLNLVCDAIVAGLTGAGGWETLRDMIDKMGKIPPAAKATAASLVVALVGVVLVVNVAGCKHAGPIVEEGAHAIIDCAKQNQDDIGAVISGLRPLLDGDRPDWGRMYDDAKAAGASIGGCALAELVQRYLAPAPGRMAPAPELGHAARDTLERFRAAVANGASFRTADGTEL